MTLHYEQATLADIPVIFQQAKELIDTYEDCSAIDYEKVLAWVRKKIENHISQYRRVLTHGKVCAYYRLCSDGELDDLYVLPPFRSNGVGSAIINKCIGESNGILYLYVFSHNFRAISFYKRFGFTVRETVGTTRLILERNG